MLTQCPACHTTFRITGAILRAAHGQVRCGQCNTQFDAIEHLIENETTAEPSPRTNADAASQETENIASSASSQIEVEEPAAEEITMEGRRIEISGIYPALDAESSDPHPHTQTIVQEFAVDEFPEAESPEPETDEAFAGETSLGADDEIALDIEVTEADIESLNDIDFPSEPPPLDEAIRAPRNEPVATTPAAGDIDDLSVDGFTSASQSSQTIVWTLLSLLLLLGLSAQVVHHFRQDLSRRADVGPYLSQIYAALHLPLEPRWSLNAYAVKQWGVVADPNGGAGGTLRLRASISNHAEFAQPYPLLRLTLEDRFGAEVGARELKPEEYLTSAAQAKRLLGAGESANADIAVVDPGEEAVGFHLNVCLQRAQGLECME